jgi:hypothetical protein
LQTRSAKTFPQLHMIENRSRIEKQILLGRQVVRHSYRGRPGARGGEADSLTENNRYISGQTKATAPGIGSSSTNSGFAAPLSADTDAEAAFTRRSPFKRRHSSKTLSSNRAEDPNAADPPRRRSQLKLSPGGSEHDPVNVLPSTKVSNSEHQSPSFFSKLGANSLSRLSLPFSSDRRAAVKQSDETHQRDSFTSSSESSSEADYTWDLDQNPDSITPNPLQ